MFNIIVAGTIARTSIVNPKGAADTIFSGAYPPSEVMRLVGFLWLGIAALSLLGLFKPVTFTPVLLLQLIYKGGWLLWVAVPALSNGLNYPKGMALFFLIWVLILPFIIPWKTWMNNPY